MADNGEGVAFPLVMRGYNTRQVNEYVRRLLQGDEVGEPEFELVMRGYERPVVDRWIEDHRPPSG